MSSATAAKNIDRLGRRERRKVITRRDLLLAARKLFSEKGLYESRVEEITERAGIAKGTLYRYFPEKEQLILAIVTAGFDDLAREVESRLRDARTFDLVVAGMVEGHVGFFRQNPDLMRIFHQVRGMLKLDRTRWRPLRRVLRRHLDRIAGWLRRTETGKALGPARRQALAVVLFGSVSGSLSVLVAAYPKPGIRPTTSALTSALVSMANEYATCLRQERRSRAPSRVADPLPRK